MVRRRPQRPVRFRVPLALVLVLLVAGVAVHALPAAAAPGVRSASSAAERSSASLTIRAPRGTVAGDVLVAAIAVRLGSSPSITPPAGWRLVRRDGHARGRAALTQSVYARLADGAEPEAYTWRFSSGTAAAGGVVAVTGVDASDPVQAHGGRSRTGTRSMTAPSVTTSADDALVLGFFASSGRGATTPPAGASERYEARVPGATSEGAAFRQATAGPTGTSTASSARRRAVTIGQLVALRATPTPEGATAGRVVWTGDMEEHDLSDWYFPTVERAGSYGGGLYGSGRQEAVASGDRAHTGSASLRATIWTPSRPTSGLRAFRWLEPRAHREAYYSAWFYIPTRYTLTADPCCGRYWNLFQFKSRSADGERNDPVWALYVGNRPNGELYLYAGWGWGGTTLAGPFSASGVGGKNYGQSIADLPIGRWTHIEAFLRQSKDFDGRLTVWQDGVELFDFGAVRTSYDNPSYNAWQTANEWSLNNYSDGLEPTPATIYIDDATIRVP